VKRNWLLYLVIFSLALNFGTIGTLVYLHYPARAERLAGEIPPPMPLKDLWGALNMDEVQRRSLRGLFPEHRARVVEMRTGLFQRRQELFGLLKGEAPDQAAIRVKIKEISSLQGSLEEEQIRFLLEFRKNLKPEQNTAFLNLMQTRLDKALGGPWGGPGDPGGGRGHRRGPGMGPGPGMPPGSPPGMGPAPMGPRCPE
jgi:Spy/CpxP family protein refolding chaperone